MKTAQERITVTKVKSAHLETITTNLAEFNLGEAVFVHKGSAGFTQDSLCAQEPSIRVEIPQEKPQEKQKLTK